MHIGWGFSILHISPKFWLSYQWGPSLEKDRRPGLLHLPADRGNILGFIDLPEKETEGGGEFGFLAGQEGEVGQSHRLVGQEGGQGQVEIGVPESGRHGGDFSDLHGAAGVG